MKDFPQLQIWERSHQLTHQIYQLILSRDLGCLPEDQFARTTTELTEIKRMLNAFIQKLRAKSQELTANC